MASASFIRMVGSLLVSCLLLGEIHILLSLDTMPHWEVELAARLLDEHEVATGAAYIVNVVPLVVLKTFAMKTGSRRGTSMI
jgi:hypothetical protein